MNPVRMQPINRHVPETSVFKDLNGDNRITAEDRTFLGSPLPDIVFGLPITMSYGDFDLYMFFQGQAGNEIFKCHELLFV